MLKQALVRGASLLFVLCFVAPTGAQQDSSRRQIEEVIVTAEKREASIQDTSISITAFTGEFLDDFGIRNQEDLQNYIPATTIQPYDATVRGVGRNFRALGGDPGVSTYANGIYSEDLLTITAQTFFDVERVEVLRGPQGTLFGRNAVGGAINILYKEPSQALEGSVRSIFGNYGTQDYYLALSGPVIPDKLAARFTGAYRDRDGVVDDLGPRPGIDGLGTQSTAFQLLFTPNDQLRLKLRTNRLDINRSFGGANGGGLVVLNEGQGAGRVTDSLIGGFRPIDRTNTNPANILQNSFYDASSPVYTFTDPVSGTPVDAQRMRLGIDPDNTGEGGNSITGTLNAAASMDAFGVTSPESAARLNNCVFDSGNIDGNKVCAATNGFNLEEFEQNGYSFDSTWDATDTLSFRYLFGYNRLSYERVTDDDNTNSQFYDRQFYVNHEARYRSHELQVNWNLTDAITVTSGAFFYNAIIDQRGDFYDSTLSGRFDTPGPDGGFVSLIFGGPAVSLYTANDACNAPDAGPTCARNNGGTNTVLSVFPGDDGSNPNLNVINGPNTAGSDLLYATQTRRKAFAFYTQGTWDINQRLALTLGLRYASDNLVSEENLWRYSELDEFNVGGDGVTDADGDGVPDPPFFVSIFDDGNGRLTLSDLPPFAGLPKITVAQFNLLNGGLINNLDGTFTPTSKAVTGLPVALSVYRGFERTDRRFGWRFNLDYHLTDDAMVYISATKAHRSGGNNLVFFSNTFDYDPEELINYELGYKTAWLDNTLQVNGSFYYYNYKTIHTVGTEVSAIGGLSTSVLPAPGARVLGVEVEGTWLISDNLTAGGNFSFTPSKYTKSLKLLDPARNNEPSTLFDNLQLAEDIKGNQLLQVPKTKFTLWGNYRITLPGASSVDLRSTYAWTDEVYYSPFQRDQEKAPAYGRTDVRATWTGPNRNLTAALFVNNVFNTVGILQILREGEGEFFRHATGTTVPRLYGIELGYQFGDY